MKARALLLISMFLISALAGCMDEGAEMVDKEDFKDEDSLENRTKPDLPDDPKKEPTTEEDPKPTVNPHIDTKHPLVPIQFIWSVHVEGWTNEAMDESAFDGHVSELETMRAILEEAGIKITWEIRPDQFLLAAVKFNSTILDDWIAAGHTVQLHADLGGESNDTDLLTNQLRNYVTQMADEGYTPTGVSGMCSAADWVQSLLENGIVTMHGVVDFCIKSMPNENIPDEFALVKDCWNPNECHSSVYYNVTDKSITPWRTLSPSNWLSQGGNSSMPLIIPGGPWDGTLKCLDEGYGNNCKLTPADADAIEAKMPEIMSARSPGLFHAFGITESVGGVVEEAALKSVADLLKGHIASGNLSSVTSIELLANYEKWEKTGQLEGPQVVEEELELTDLVYATVDGKDIKLDIQLPEGDGPHPLVIYIHPGAFKMGSKDDVDSKPAVLAALDEGWAIASIDYRLSHEAIWPAQIHDCKAAVRWLRANAATYDLNPDMFVAWGMSAGAMLAAMLEVSEGSSYHEDLTMGNANFSSEVQAVIDWYGPVDAQYIMDKAANETDSSLPPSPHVALLGCELANCSQALLDSANVRTMLDGNESPFLIMHGTADEAVNVTNSIKLVERFADLGVDVEVHYLDGVGHGSDQAWRAPAQIAKAMQFLQSLLNENA